MTEKEKMQKTIRYVVQLVVEMYGVIEHIQRACDEERHTSPEAERLAERITVIIETADLL